MGEGKGEVREEVLNDVVMEIENPLRVDCKRDHECLVDGSLIESCAKRQATEVCNNSEFVVHVEVLNDGAVDIEDNLIVESNRNHEWVVVDGKVTKTCTKSPGLEASNNTELVVYGKTQEGEFSNDVSNDSELDHGIGEQGKGTLGDCEREPYVEKQADEGLNDVELDVSANHQLKEASNDDIFSEVSNPNLSPSTRDITSKLQTGGNQLVEPVENNLGGSGQVTTARSGNSWAEESFSEEDNVSSRISRAVPKSCVVLEIPKHASTTGIRKITLKFSKRKEDYDKGAAASAVQPVTNAFRDETLQNLLVPGHIDSELNSCTHEKGGYESINPLFSSPNMDLKMTKKVMADSHLPNVKKLLSTRILEGARVKYIPTGGGTELPGIVKDCGYLCGCSLCNFSKVISAYEFELHAGVKTRHPNNHIYLENGRPIYSIIQELKTAPISKVEEVVKAVAGSSVNEEYFQIWKANIQQNNEVSIADQSYYGKPIVKHHPLPRPRAIPASAAHKKTAEGGAKKRDNDLHRLLFMPNGLPDGTDLAYYSKGKRIMGGYKQGNGIVCNCCHAEISPSQFEAHAGWAAKRQPYRHIYTSTGLTLHDIAIMLATGQTLTSTHSDDMCAACGDGGELIICDGCPRAFHPACLGLQPAPTNDWRCQYCRDRTLPGREAAGESRPIIIRLTRVVKAPEDVPGGCVVCRAQDFSAAKFDDRTVIICDQCEKEYHVGCLRDLGLCDLKELPKDKWFCCQECNRIYAGLQNFALGGSEVIPSSISGIIYQKQAERGVIHEPGNDIYWQILSGKSRYPEHLPLLSSAAAIFRECFDPIVARSGRDLIPVMVYGRNISGQEFGGMYCVVLVVRSVVVSACLVRIFGREVAELPLVATSRENQGKGYFQVLFGCIERLLFSLNVKNLVLPAAEEAESIWTKKFGFRKINNERMSRYRDFQLTVFKGTSMLEKEVHPVAD